MATHRVDLRLESSDFPCDDMQVSEVRGHEEISKLFRFEILVSDLSPQANDPRDMIGATATLVFSEEGAICRRVHGIIAEATNLLSTETEHRSFRLLLVPRAYRFNMVRTQEIYLDATLRQIIEQKLGLVGLAEESAFSLEDPDEPREFVVQYAETDLSFISRLTEHAGISFYFDHSGDGDRMVFTDRNEGFRMLDGAETLPFTARGERRDVYRLEAKAQLVSAMAVVSDYNYLTPQLGLASVCAIPQGYGGGIVEYHTHHQTPAQGEVLARVRAEEVRATAFVLEGEADICMLTAGARYTLVGHPWLGDVPILVTQVSHQANQVVLGGGGASAQSRYQAVFKAILADVAYRPPRTTPKPRIHGLVSGIIEAAPKIETESAWIDEHGRYLVRMLFDTAAPGERKASLPIRMMQPHSGPGYGIHFPLRPGTEVMVGFVGGDPDRPVIVGSVPNSMTPTPVVNKDAHTHRIRTWSGVLVEIDDGR